MELLGTSTTLAQTNKYFFLNEYTFLFFDLPMIFHFVEIFRQLDFSGAVCKDFSLTKYFDLLFVVFCMTSGL